jgi:hypothetical protein
VIPVLIHVAFGGSLNGTEIEKRVYLGHGTWRSSQVFVAIAAVLGCVCS